MTKQPFRFSLFLLICFSIPLAATAQTVNIPDSNLRAAIENKLGVASGATITTADMATLTHLEAKNVNISDLTGLEGATNLKSLRLGGNSISGIAPVTGLTNLKVLSLWTNSISDISPVEALTNLTELNLSGNLISDISPVADLNQLTWLHLQSNRILDIAALASLTNLTALRLDRNSISDISVLSRLIQLTELRLDRNSLTDLSPLVANTGLGSGDTVNVKGNPLNRASIQTHIPALQSRGVAVEFDDVVAELVDIPDSNLRAAVEDALGVASGDTITTADMATLTRLEAPEASISDLTGLEGATKLTRLDLGDNAIRDISPVAGLTNLTFLEFSNNLVSDLSPLAGLTNLTELSLDFNNITDISVLAGLPNLIDLALGYNAITDHSILSGLTNLTSLDLRSTNTSDLSVLSGLTKLEQLYIDRNGISDLSPLAGLTNLRSLGLNSNSISDLSPLRGLTNLRWMRLAENNITDLSPLVANTGLGSGDWIDVKENPLNYASIKTHIPALLSRGVAVEFDDVVTEPVDIPDPNLRAAIERELGKASGSIITTADMGRLTELVARNFNITDLTGLEHATNLTSLDLGTEYVGAEGRPINSNSVSDLLPLAGLTNLTSLSLDNNTISDLSPLAGLTSLTWLYLWNNTISDLSPLAGLTSLTWLYLWNNTISDLSPVAGLTNLTRMGLRHNNISDLSPLAGLTNLTWLDLRHNNISDLPLLAANTGLESGDEVLLNDNPLNYSAINTHIPALKSRGVAVEFDDVVTELVDIPDPNLRAAIESTLGVASGDTITTADMGRLTELVARNSNISDLTGLEDATNLTSLDLGTENVEGQGRPINSNSVSDLSPLSGLTNLTWLRLRNNSISDISALSGLTNLTWLNLGSNLMISDISALSGLTNLEILWLYGNSISDLSPLAGLANLAQLTLWFNSVSDLSPLAGLTNLGYLGLYNNLISDLSPLAGLTNLEYLGLSNFSIVFPTTGLTHLSLNNNTISDLSPLVANTGLGSGDIVEVLGNPLSDASIHDHIPALRNRGVTVEFIRTPTALLKISGTVTESDNLLIVEVRDDRGRLHEGVTVTFTVISGGGTLSATSATTDANGRAESRLTLGPDTGTNRVSASVEGISESVTFSDVPEPPVDILDPNLRAAIEAQLDKTSDDTITASDMARLTELFAQNSNISDLTGLESATNLIALFLGAQYVEAEGRNVNSNSISDLSPLAELTNLEFLVLDSNLVSDISAVAELTNLTTLLLNSNLVSDISAVAELTNLTTLWLNSNSITDISVVSGLTNLTDVDLWGNTISDISAVAGLTNLEFLVLGRNMISDISVVAGLTNLRFLLLNDNSISDLSPLVENMGLGEEDWVGVQRNPLSFPSIYTHIPALQSRGVRVGFDPQLPDLLSEHTAEVVSVAFSSRGTLASGGQDGTVILWDAVTEQPIATLMGHTASARSVAFSPDGSILASGSYDDTVILWDVATQQPKDTLTEHTAPVETVAFSPDGSTLASGSQDGTVILWDVDAGQPKDTIMGHANRVWSLAFSPDGTLAIGRNDGTVLLWDVATGQPKDTLTGHTAFVESVAFTRDGSTLASGSGDRTVILWEVATGQPIAILPGHTAGVNSVAFSPDGTMLASGSDDTTVRLWDVIMGQPIATLTGHTSWVRSVAFTRDGSTLASGSGDRTVLLWEIAPGPLEYTLSIPADLNLIHVPLKVTAVDGVAKTIESISDLYDALGGASKVIFLATHDSQTQQWAGYFGPADKGTPVDKGLTDDMGILANMIAPTSVRLSGNPLGTNGTSTITLNPEFNVVGLPLRDSNISRVSDLLALDGIRDNVHTIIFTDNGDFKLVIQKLVIQATDPSNIPIVGGQAFMLYAQRAETVTISGEGWDNTSAMAAAPPVRDADLHSPLTGIQVTDTTPVLGLKGLIVDEGTGLKVAGFRVTVKNLSAGRAATAVTGSDEPDYRLIIVDIETERAAMIGDILEISAQSPNPFIGVKPLWYTVTAEDVKRTLIQLPELVTYEIPTETELLHNYPNPFNPETWIPYRLAEDAFVTLTIYDRSGQIVHTLDVGHQIAAVYESRSKAVYWDGRNGLGEQVASGVYFYHLSAGDFSATRKMVILK